MKKRRMTAALLVTAALCFAQEDEEGVRLPGAEISAEKETAEHITREQINERGDSDLWQAMRHIPGVVLSGGGSRNESAFTLRGLGATDVPVYVDGIPWIDPSRGQVDYARFLSGDLESIDIMKGYTSMLLGPNNLGGAVVMRLAKPKNPLEIFAKSTIEFDAGGYAANTETVSAGTKFDLFYAKATFQWRGRDHWRLPDAFIPSFDTDGGLEPGDGGNPQRDGNRFCSEQRDMKVSALVGFTPLDPLDIWVSYVFSDSDKGFSAPGTNGTSYSIWEWPFITRHTASLNAKWTGDRINGSLLGYFDKFDNRLNPYATFGGPDGSGKNAWNNGYLVGKHQISDYDDWTAGANLDGNFKIGEMHKVSAAAQWRKTTHKVYDFANGETPDHTDAKKTTDIDEDMFFIGAEYAINPITPFTAIVGFGVDIFKPQTMWKTGSRGAVIDTLTDTLAGPQWSAALFYDLSENHELHLSYAKKNRFPTIFERTSSQGDGQNAPNLGLKPVEAHNFELGYKGYFLSRINVNMAAYYNYVYNYITTVTLPVPTPENYTRRQENVDETAFYGFEFSSEMYVSDYLALRGRFGAQRYDIGHSESKYIVLGSKPELTFGASLVITPLANVETSVFDNIKIIPSLEYVGSRLASSYTETQEQKILPSHTLVHIKLSCDITKYAALAFDVRNLFDELYEISTGFPQPGRSFSISVEGRY